MEIVHLRAHARMKRIDLLRQPTATRLWWLLRRAFPLCLAAVLMTYHLHLIAVVFSAEWARLRLAKALGAAARGRGSGVWEPVELPFVHVDPVHLRRDLRYVPLNPPRAGLVEDPLEWTWSTHREVMGAVADPWVDIRRLKSHFDCFEGRFPANYHRYVSSDPSVDVAGTPPNVAERERTLPVRSLEDIAVASVAAHRGQLRDVRRSGPVRDTFLALCREQGWTDTTAIANRCGLTQSSIRRRSPVDPGRAALDAALVCLGDERLLRPFRE